MIRKQIADVVADIVAAIPIEFVSLTGPVDNGDGTFTYTTCDTLWLMPCKTVRIGPQPLYDDRPAFVIDSFVVDQSVTFKLPLANTPIPAETTFDIYPPIYVHGTPIAVESELQSITDGDDKTPMIYLYELLKERNFRLDRLNPMEAEAELRIYFMDSSDPGNQVIADHYEQTVTITRKLIDKFMDVIDRDKGKFGRIEVFDVIPRVEFGLFIRAQGDISQGAESLVLGENLSGNELRFLLRVQPLACNPTGPCN